jgi:hypothetical protein
MFFYDATDVMVINNTMEGANAAATGIDLYDAVVNSVFVGNAVRGGPTAYTSGINVVSATSTNNIITDNQFSNVTAQISDTGTDTKLQTLHHRATTNPTAANSISTGYAVGTIWINTTSQAVYICVDSTAGAAVWQSIGNSGAIAGTTSNTFTLDSDDTGGNVSLQFGTTLAETLTWDSTNTRFNLSDDLNLTGGLMTSANSLFGATGAGATMVDINGDMALRRADVTAANGNNNNFAVGAFSFIRLTGPTAAFAITGISGGQNGKVIILYNSTTQAMTINNESTNSTAANRITTLTGGNQVTAGVGSAMLIYDGNSSRWLMIAWQA